MSTLGVFISVDVHADAAPKASTSLGAELSVFTCLYLLFFSYSCSKVTAVLDGLYLKLYTREIADFHHSVSEINTRLKSSYELNSSSVGLHTGRLG